jgi:acetylornithine deacetylase/succinyl-diaminopimelate desuccinylase-like protein
MKYKAVLCQLVFLMFCQNSKAQYSTLEKAAAYSNTQQLPYLQEFKSFLNIPNVAMDTAGLQNTAKHIVNMMHQLGLTPELLKPVSLQGAPAIFANYIVPGASKTIVLYAHYDGQPVNPNQWAEGLQPFAAQYASQAIDKGGILIDFPSKREDILPQHRIYARSASDDKAGVFAILKAFEALKATGAQPGSNIKFFFEGEEEMGSPHLAEILESHKAKLGSDLWIICDGPVHQSGQKQVVFGVRGDVGMELKVYASKRPLHSGHYGNWAPNPAQKLAALLASMKDKNGNVLIKGFYDDVTPLSAQEKQAIAAVPPVDEALMEELGFAQPEGGTKRLVALINRPSLNINGFLAANIGRLAANVIPTSATASLDLRLVLGNDPQRQVQKVITHIKKQGYYVTENESITDEERRKYPNIIRVTASNGYPAQRTPMQLPIAQEVIKAVQNTGKEPIVLMPSLGGSLPLFLFEKHLGAKTITVPIANHDNNQHAENENIRLKNLWDGIATYIALMLIK